MSQNKFNITIGSDPEVFTERNGKIVSAIGMIPGSKHEPHPISDKGHFIQTDNIAMEFNIPPCSTEDEFVENITFVKDYLETIAIANGCTLSTKASDVIDAEELKDPQARVFGCEPDLNPYTKSVNPSPNKKTNLRCVGGHIHIGYPNANQETTEKIVKAFDIFVTLPALLKDNDTRRRELYGKAGAFRFKDPWGLECRALSNFWIHSEEDMRWVYRQTIKAVECVLEGQIDDFITNWSDQVVEAINTNNTELAQKILQFVDVNETVTK